MKFILNLGLISWIVFVGIFDTVVTFLTKSTITAFEKNPISLFLIEQIGLSFFLCIKIVLTFVVASLLICMVLAAKNDASIPKRITIYIDIIILVIFTFQTWLFYYLNWSGNQEMRIDSTVWNMFIMFFQEL